MIQVNKMEAFALVVKALDKNDAVTASEIMKIIKKSMIFDKEKNQFSEIIEIADKKDERVYETAKLRYDK